MRRLLLLLAALSVLSACEDVEEDPVRITVPACRPPDIEQGILTIGATSFEPYQVQASAITDATGRPALSIGEHILSTPIPAGGTVREGRNVELGDVVTVVPEPGSYSLYRRDGRPAEMVLAEVAGRFESPIYGMLAVEKAIGEMDWGEAGPPDIRYHGQPEDESKITLLWDGEWEVTYVTFRDMGAAFGIAILGIYLLVVAQFGSFKLPLVILIPVPLTLIGIVLGHWAFGAAFTATSMIGFIALAGIIVRNSILLVDFIQHRRAEVGDVSGGVVMWRKGLRGVA